MTTRKYDSACARAYPLFLRIASHQTRSVWSIASCGLSLSAVKYTHSTRHSGEGRNPASAVNECRCRIDRIMQILPVGVHGFDQPDLPPPLPFLYLLFSGNGLFHGMAMLVPNKYFDVMLRGKARRRFVLVIANALPQCACHPDIERSAITACQDVNSRMLFPAHPVNLVDPSQHSKPKRDSGLRRNDGGGGRRMDDHVFQMAGSAI